MNTATAAPKQGDPSSEAYSMEKLRRGRQSSKHRREGILSREREREKGREREREREGKEPSFIAPVQCGINKDEIKGASVQPNRAHARALAEEGKVCQ